MASPECAAGEKTRNSARRLNLVVPSMSRVAPRVPHFTPEKRLMPPRRGLGNQPRSRSSGKLVLSNKNRTTSPAQAKLPMEVEQLLRNVVRLPTRKSSRLSRPNPKFAPSISLVVPRISAVDVLESGAIPAPAIKPFPLETCEIIGEHFVPPDGSPLISSGSLDFGEESLPEKAKMSTKKPAQRPLTKSSTKKSLPPAASTNPYAMSPRRSERTQNQSSKPVQGLPAGQSSPTPAAEKALVGLLDAATTFTPRKLASEFAACMTHPAKSDGHSSVSAKIAAQGAPDKSAVRKRSRVDTPIGEQPRKRGRPAKSVAAVVDQLKSASLDRNSQKANGSKSIGTPDTGRRSKSSDHLLFSQKFTKLEESFRTGMEASRSSSRTRIGVRGNLLSWFSDKESTEESHLPLGLKKDLATFSQASTSSTQGGSIRAKRRMLLESLEEEETADVPMMTLSEDLILLASQFRDKRTKSRTASQTGGETQLSLPASGPGASTSVIPATLSTIQSPVGSFHTAVSPPQLSTQTSLLSAASSPRSVDSRHSALEDIAAVKDGSFPRSVASGRSGSHFDHEFGSPSGLSRDHSSSPADGFMLDQLTIKHSSPNEKHSAHEIPEKASDKRPFEASGTGNSFSSGTRSAGTQWETPPSTVTSILSYNLKFHKFWVLCHDGSKTTLPYREMHENEATRKLLLTFLEKSADETILKNGGHRLD